MTMIRWAALIAAMLVGISAAGAVDPDERLADPGLEARARALSAELRCMVCQNQSIDDSDAALAKDLRVLVRERIKSGDSDDEVIDYLVARYGEFVLLRPPFNSRTLFLWFAPVLLLLGVGIYVLIRMRAVGVDQHAAAAVPADADGPRPLSPDEQRRLASLTADGSGSSAHNS